MAQHLALAKLQVLMHGKYARKKNLEENYTSKHSSEMPFQVPLRVSLNELVSAL